MVLFYYYYYDYCHHHLNISSLPATLKMIDVPRTQPTKPVHINGMTKVQSDYGIKGVSKFSSACSPLMSPGSLMACTFSKLCLCERIH